jgi:hypothetical protein
MGAGHDYGHHRSSRLAERQRRPESHRSDDIRSWPDSRDLLRVLGLSSWAVSSILVQGSVRV